ncbi:MULTISPECIES: MFS transporter [unclassified Bacillus (in: firmicutes)]|uniref:MFS transporter n=1 Tax=unclassified Bacillus (in: firmicutes) TaxID=185979 RepID=UPI0008F1213C|nr:MULTISPECIES: MFS transporter [unclassified Bacillus (in: firmicutes)]SFH98047.1 Predicted arabinose efflux permease, MFS family [Bacillus sp. 71mf]SFS94013.1 Predicted arabinose efflux permease, MFS family [Bacillus sp. 103mf]
MTKNSPLTYKDLLKNNIPFRNLFFALSISTLGDWFYSVALIGFIYITTNSPQVVSMILLAGALPRLLFSPFVGVFIDRFNKKKIMIITDLFRGCLIILAIPFSNYLPALFILTILNSVISIFFTPARQTIIPAIVHKNDLAIANSLSNVIYGAMGILGASLGGALTALISYKFAFLIDSLSFFLCALIVSFTAIPLIKNSTQSQQTTYMQSIVEGFRFILQNKIVSALVFVGMSWGIVAGAYQVLIIIYATKIFHAEDIGIGILYSTQGLGTLVGSWIVAKYYSTNTNKMKKVFGWAYLIQGLFFVFFIISSQLWLGVILLFIMRAAGGLISPIDSTLLQKYTPNEMLGRVFTFHTVTYSSFMQLSTFFTGILLSYISPQCVGLLFGLLCVIVSLYWLIAYYTNKLTEPVGKQPSIERSC